MTGKHDKFYDRLPLPMAQVMRDVAVWRAHVLNNRDQSAEDTLLHLAESADELDRWEAEQEPTDRFTLHQGSTIKLRLVPDDPEE